MCARRLRFGVRRDARGAIAIIDEAQAFEGEAVVDFGDIFRFASDEVGEATGGDAFGFGTELRDHALEDGIDEADVTPEEADLKIVDGIRADDLRGAANFDAGQAGSAGEEGFGGNVEAGSDGSAEEFALLRDDVEVGGRAEVDDDGGTSIFVERAHAVGDTVGADFAGIVGEDRQAGFDAGLDEERPLAEVALAELAEDPVDRGNDGGDDDAADGAGFDALGARRQLGSSGR